MIDIKGNGMTYSLPRVFNGRLHRGVISVENVPSALKALTRHRWVILHCQHYAAAPRVHSEVDLYQVDPFYRTNLGTRPYVLAIPRDFADPSVYRPLDIPKDHDIVFNACWNPVKRPMLLLEALKLAKQKGRPISALWYGYHWQNGKWGTSDREEQIIRSEVTKHALSVTFLPTDWSGEENNRRFNRCRLNIITSSHEAGPRVMSEGMLAGLPYLTANDIVGGSKAHVTDTNGVLFDATPDSIAKTIWAALDRLPSFAPREWALQHMCRPIAVERMKTALRDLAERKKWDINVDEVDHGGETCNRWRELAEEGERT